MEKTPHFKQQREFWTSPSKSSMSERNYSRHNIKKFTLEPQLIRNPYVPFTSDLLQLALWLTARVLGTRLLEAGGWLGGTDLRGRTRLIRARICDIYRQTLKRERLAGLNKNIKREGGKQKLGWMAFFLTRRNISG